MTTLEREIATVTAWAMSQSFELRTIGEVKREGTDTTAYNITGQRASTAEGESL